MSALEWRRPEPSPAPGDYVAWAQGSAGVVHIDGNTPDWYGDPWLVIGPLPSALEAYAAIYGMGTDIAEGKP